MRRGVSECLPVLPPLSSVLDPRSWADRCLIGGHLRLTCEVFVCRVNLHLPLWCEVSVCRVHTREGGADSCVCWTLVSN